MKVNKDVEAVDMVDTLMMHFRNGAKPCDADVVKAYELGINVKALKQYIEEVENEGEAKQVEDEYGWDDTGEEG